MIPHYLFRLMGVDDVDLMDGMDTVDDPLHVQQPAFKTM
jgi:hypothetical protein